MFWLWNELFGFPVNSCDYENIECNKSYVPILNWDNDNEFVWSLWDPIEWGVDASNVTFNSKDIQKRPASVKKVDEALEELMNMIEDSKSTIKSFSFNLNQDWETLEWTITYEDDSWREYEKTASINIKDIVEWWQVLTLKDIIADSIEADEWIFESAQAWWLDVTWDAVIQWNETVNWTVVMNSTLDVAWKATINWWADITWNLNVLEDSETHEGWEIHSKSLETTEDATIGWDLSVTWDTTIGWDTDISGNITSAWSASIWWALSVDSTATIWSTLDVWWNTTIDWNISVSWDETVEWAMNITWATTLWDDLSVWWDLTVTDDLTVNWSSHLKAVETDGSVDIDWTLRTTWAAVIWNWITVTWQVESDTVRTWEVVADEIRATNWVYLSQWWEAPDFVLQSEKWQPNGTAPLDVNWLIDTQYLPPVYTTAIVKMWTWVFSNSRTSTVVDADITSDSFVIISNYQDIIWDLTETISVWQLTVASNTEETWSYKYIIVNSIS